MQIEENISLKPYNTFGVEAKTKFFASYNSLKELLEILSNPITKENKILHIGGGSNLLFLNDFDGLILHSNIQHISVEREDDDTVVLRVGAGVVWDDFVAHCVEHSYYGVENLSLIPGEVGSSAVQNIGAYGMEAKDTIFYVKGIYLDILKEFQLTNEECKFDYRESIFKNELKGKIVITEVAFKLSKNPHFLLDYSHLKDSVLANGDITLKNVRDTVIQIRTSKLPDPKVIGNAGSYFMNPIIPLEKYNQLLELFPNMPHYSVTPTSVKIPAGWLIEHCGLRGKKFENVGIYEKQALVIVNLGNATGKDIAKVASLVQLTVKKKFDIDIYPEVTYIT